jgi:Ca2+-binding RTX toxin-like protein
MTRLRPIRLLGVITVAILAEGVAAGAYPNCDIPYATDDCTTTAPICGHVGGAVTCNLDPGKKGGTTNTSLAVSVHYGPGGIGGGGQLGLIVYGVDSGGNEYCCKQSDFGFGGYPTAFTVIGADNATKSDVIDLSNFREIGATIDAMSGDDTIDGACVMGAFADIGDEIDAGPGEDTVDGCHGDDTIYGGEDDDWVYGNYGDDTIYAGDGLGNGGAYNFLAGGPGSDVIAGSQDAGGGDDIYGDDGEGTLPGSPTVNDVDYLYGYGGDDELCGEWGSDYLYGGDGDDWLYGGPEDDAAMNGGNDWDHCEDDSPKTSCNFIPYLTSCSI